MERHRSIRRQNSSPRAESATATGARFDIDSQNYYGSNNTGAGAGYNSDDGLGVGIGLSRSQSGRYVSTTQLRDPLSANANGNGHHYQHQHQISAATIAKDQYLMADPPLDISKYLKLATTAAPDGTRARSLRDRLLLWLMHDGQNTIFLAIWIVLQCLAFTLSCMNYQYSGDFVRTRVLLGWSFVIARAAALVLHINVALILLPMCRTVISWLRTTSLNRVIDFDASTAFHKVIGWSLLVFTLVHTGAHYRNFYIVANQSPNSPSFAYLSLVSGPGLTGHIMLLALFLIIVTAMQRVKNRNFEAFWYTHHLFIVFFAGFSIHGGFCFLRTDRPPYCGAGSSFWKYWLFSGLLYGFERIMREIRARRQTVVTRVVQHPSNVVEIRFKKDGFHYKSGQYIYVNCPEVSLHQWHPFTLTSAPGEDSISIHMRVVGDFTKALATRLGANLLKKNSPEYRRQQMMQRRSHDISTVMRVLPLIQIDGPFGAASEDVFNYEVAFLVGAGIGVTPFASVLKSILFRSIYADGNNGQSGAAVGSASNINLTANNISGSGSDGVSAHPIRLKKVYFVWVCRDISMFEWFQDLLLSIESSDTHHLIEIHSYLTARFDQATVGNLMMNDEAGERDAATGLRSPTNYGRPNFNAIFHALTDRHPATDIGVFFCGNPAMGNTLKMCCRKYNQPEAHGTKFYYNKENF
ncbi:hypothetical protein GQ42DRAFT_165716 [Ramicandelaber brevisporus]|nr:hypothetical protein GQ42DRAFT_165716 [Ramicandelaber brevisporus]